MGRSDDFRSRLRNRAGKAVREECMKSHIDEAADAVLKAADLWVTAQEALIAAKQAANENEAKEEAVDIAGVRLVAAVTRWRSCRELR